LFHKALYFNQIFKLKIPTTSDRNITIKQQREVIWLDSRESLLRDIGKLSFPIKREENLSILDHDGELWLLNDLKFPPTRGMEDIHETLIKAEFIKFQHSWWLSGVAWSLTRVADDIKIAKNTPWCLPPTKWWHQLQEVLWTKLSWRLPAIED
jgi:hypothetical protein